MPHSNVIHFCDNLRDSKLHIKSIVSGLQSSTENTKKLKLLGKLKILHEQSFRKIDIDRGDSLSRYTTLLVGTTKKLVWINVLLPSTRNIQGFA